MTKISKLTTAIVLSGGLIAGIAAASAETTAPSASSEKGMMPDGGMMPMMKEMSEMMGNCNKMMQTMTDRQNQGGSTQQPPDKRG